LQSAHTLLRNPLPHTTHSASMTRVLALALTAFAIQRAGAVDSATETDMEAYLDVVAGAVSAGAQAAEVQELSGQGHRAYMDVTVGAVSAGAQAAEVQELNAQGHRAYMDVTVGAVSAGAQAAEVQELSGHGQRAYMDVTVGAVSAGAQAAEVQELSGHGQRAYLDITTGAVGAGAQAAEVQELSAAASESEMEELDTGDRPKGARRRAHERGLQAELVGEISSKGCAELGGKWFSDPNGVAFQIEQKGCMIDFMLTVAKSPKKHRKRGVIRGTTVLIEPPFPEGQVLANQTVRFGKDGDWVRKL